MLKLYGFSKVNAAARGHTRDLRVLWALEEMQLPFEPAGMDHPADDLNTEAYRRLSPFEQIPSIDDDGLVLSESAAILVYLAKKSGRLIPGDRAGEAQVVRWCFAAMNSVEPPLLSLLVLDWMADGSCGKHREFLVGWVNRVLTNLERWFAGRDFVATNDFTIADILMAHVLLSGIKDEGLIAPYPGVRSYPGAWLGPPGSGPSRHTARGSRRDSRCCRLRQPRSSGKDSHRSFRRHSCPSSRFKLSRYPSTATGPVPGKASMRPWAWAGSRCINGSSTPARSRRCSEGRAAAPTWTMRLPGAASTSRRVDPGPQHVRPGARPLA
jgi:glutathione S-transferase